MISPNVLMISPDVLNITQCTHGIPPHASWYPPMYWTSPNVFMISPSPMHSWYPPMYLTPPMYSWYSPMYWTPPMYWISPDVLNTHYTRWFYVHIKSTNGNILVFSCSIVNLCISDVTQSIVLQFVENLKKHIWFLSFFLRKCDCFIWNGPVNIHVIIR